MRSVNNFGSIVVKKILTIISAITLCFSGFIFIVSIINSSIKEQNTAFNVINLNNYKYKSPELEITSNSIKVNIEQNITNVFLDFHSPGSWTHSGYPNSMIEIKKSNTSFSLHFYVKKGVTYYVSYDCKHLQGKSFYWSCEISKDKKNLTNLKFTSSKEQYPDTIVAIITKKEGDVYYV